jgi:hypothetical protein
VSTNVIDSDHSLAGVRGRRRARCRTVYGLTHRHSSAAAIDLKAVPGIGAEIALTVDGEWRKMRLFRSHEQAELAGAIADTRTMFEGKGMGVNDLTHTTRAVLASLEQQRVRPATRDPWSYDRHDPATRAAEREGINHLRAVVPTLALSHGQRLHCHPPMAPRHHALRHALVADGTARPHVPTSWKSKGVGLELRYTRNEKAVRAAHLHGRCGATQGRGDGSTWEAEGWSGSTQRTGSTPEA